MRMTLIYTQEANSEEDILYPGLDGASRITIKSEDGDPERFMVQTIKCLDQINGRGEFPFWLNDIRDNSWEVIITDQRIAVHNPFSKGLIGKAKEKPGKASVGHLYYKSICSLSTFFSEDNDNPVLICACYRKDGTLSSITIESSDLAEMKKMVAELHGRIEKWITVNKKKIEINDSTDEDIKKVVNDWDTFLERVWTVKGGEVRAYIPCESWDLVANSIL